MNDTPDTEPVYRHPQATPNEAVKLYSGPAVVAGSNATEGSGHLVLRWLPSPGLRLDVDLSSGHPPESRARVLVDIAGSSADTQVNRTTLAMTEGLFFARFSGSVSWFETGAGTGLSSIGFQVVNFSDFLTPGPRSGGVFGFPPHVAELHADRWRIRMSAVKDSKVIFDSLKEVGGYAFTHLGELERADGAPFDVREADDVLIALTRFLSFAHGAACHLPVRWGLSPDGEVVWEGWGSPIVDPWRERAGWFDEHHGNLLSEVFPSFAQAYADADLGGPMSLALHWYQKSNTRAGGMEGAIVLGLTALDLLGALAIVDRAKTMSASACDKLTAAEKLTRLLGLLKVPSTFPKRAANLATFADTNGWKDTAVALTEIRHGYVHANRKRRDVVLAAPNLATFEAWQLALWYQELALLFLLNHRGQYQNRQTAEWVGQVETVPWA